MIKTSKSSVYDSSSIQLSDLFWPFERIKDCRVYKI